MLKDHPKIGKSIAFEPTKHCPKIGQHSMNLYQTLPATNLKSSATCDRSKDKMAKRFSWFQSFTVQSADAEMKIFSWNLSEKCVEK